MTLKLNQFYFSVIDAAATRVAARCRAATRVAARQRAVCERGLTVIMRPSSLALGGGRILRRTLSVCLSVCLSVRPVRPVLERHLAPPSELQ